MVQLVEQPLGAGAHLVTFGQRGVTRTFVEQDWKIVGFSATNNFLALSDQRLGLA
jgi:hypothetical protein